MLTLQWQKHNWYWTEVSPKFTKTLWKLKKGYTHVSIGDAGMGIWVLGSWGVWGLLKTSFRSITTFQMPSIQVDIIIYKFKDLIHIFRKLLPFSIRQLYYKANYLKHKAFPWQLRRSVFLFILSPEKLQEALQDIYDDPVRSKLFFLHYPG